MDGIEEKVIQVQAGDVREYACIVERFQQPLYLYCTRLLGKPAGSGGCGAGGAGQGL